MHAYIYTRDPSKIFFRHCRGSRESSGCLLSIIWLRSLLN